MSKRLVNDFISKVNSVLDFNPTGSAYGSNFIKEYIGDSTSNNRTLTVRQVIRFLSQHPHRGYKTLARQVEEVYNILTEELQENRSNNRTDAYDVNEFLNVVTQTYSFDKEIRKAVVDALS